MSVLITGAAGYIASHTVKLLAESGESIIALDNLSMGNSEAIKGQLLYTGSYGDFSLLQDIFTRHKIDTVIHFGASTNIGECLGSPNLYYQNNVVNSLTLLNAMNAYDVKNIIFSSSASVFGEPQTPTMFEDHQRVPANTYGRTKLAFEWILEAFATAYDFKYMAFRYFNASGAHPDGSIGEDHKPEHHLIPLILQVALGQKECINVFGNDYPTFDGTCVRDYIHVCDIARAHILALNALRADHESTFYNLGNHKGFSINQVIECAKLITGKDIPTNYVDRRPGDPSLSICGSDLITQDLGWHPTHKSLEEIMETAWRWHKNNPNGYTK